MSKKPVAKKTVAKKTGEKKVAMNATERQIVVETRNTLFLSFYHITDTDFNHLKSDDACIGSSFNDEETDYALLDLTRWDTREYFYGTHVFSSAMHKSVEFALKNGFNCILFISPVLFPNADKTGILPVVQG